jgi:hypothetical protein
MKWLAQFARLIRRIWPPLPWRGEPKEIIIDLRLVSSRDEFQREMSKHFPIPADHSELWAALYDAILMYKAGPRTVRFLGWAGFEQRMPRYARRLKGLLLGHYQAWGTKIGRKLLTVEWR